MSECAQVWVQSYWKTFPRAKRSRPASSESSSHGTDDLLWDEDEKLNDDVIFTNAKHKALMDQYDTLLALLRQRKHVERRIRKLDPARRYLDDTIKIVCLVSKCHQPA